MGLSSGHSELFVAISQLKELRTATKAQIAAQESAIDDLFKWSTKENNRAIQDVIERCSELCTFWTEAQKMFVDELKIVRNHFEMILEGEKGVDAAKGMVEASEAKEIKLRKEEKKLRKRSSSNIDELSEIQDKIAKVQREKDYAEHEASSKVKDHELVKMIRTKEALKKLCSGQLQMFETGKIIFNAAHQVIEQMPELKIEMTDQDIENMSYRGSSITTQIVLQTKNRLSEMPPRSSSTTSSMDSSATLPSSPPAYDEISRQPPSNPFFDPDPDNRNPLAPLYPDLNRRRSYHGDFN